MGAICDRTVVMYAGQIVEVRASGLLHDDPLHPYTAALAAARPDIAQTAHRLRAIPGRPLSAFEAPPSECAFAAVSYILISHDLAVVRQLTDEAIVLHRGEVVERGRTAQILDDPQHAYTQRLRASVPRPG
jgi:oligopeptide/dipeptide ABC transporter ATP-binding protein